MIDFKEGGQNWMLSVWRPSAEDLKALNDGHGITLSILGTSHPVVAVGITNIPMVDVPIVP